jgi:hypothetical protein
MRRKESEAHKENVILFALKYALLTGTAAHVSVAYMIEHNLEKFTTGFLEKLLYVLNDQHGLLIDIESVERLHEFEECWGGTIQALEKALEGRVRI